jgi:hypothetical protein
LNIAGGNPSSSGAGASASQQQVSGSSQARPRPEPIPDPRRFIAQTVCIPPTTACATSLDICINDQPAN